MCAHVTHHTNSIKKTTASPKTTNSRTNPQTHKPTHQHQPKPYPHNTMAPPRRHWVKLKLPSPFLKTLPDFPQPILKSKAASIAKAAAVVVSNTTTSSTSNASNAATNSAGDGEAALGSSKINSGLKELSTSGLTMNSPSTHYALDKTGRSKKWVKKEVQFKAFSGFKVTYEKWLPEDVDGAANEKKTEDDTAANDSEAVEKEDDDNENDNERGEDVDSTPIPEVKVEA